MVSPLSSIQLEGKLETFFEDFEFDWKWLLMILKKLLMYQLLMPSAHPSLESWSFLLFTTFIVLVQLAWPLSEFLCPRKDANGITFCLEEGRWNCIEGDNWTNLASGANSIKRASSEVSTVVPDVPDKCSTLEQSEGGSMDSASTNVAVVSPKRMFCQRYHWRNGSLSSLLSLMVLLILLSQRTRLLAVPHLPVKESMVKSTLTDALLVSPSIEESQTKESHSNSQFGGKSQLSSPSMIIMKNTKLYLALERLIWTMKYMHCVDRPYFIFICPCLN